MLEGVSAGGGKMRDDGGKLCRPGGWRMLEEVFSAPGGLGRVVVLAFLGRVRDGRGLITAPTRDVEEGVCLRPRRDVGRDI